MSILRPILSPVLRPVWPVPVIAGTAAEDLLFLLLGADGSLTTIGPVAMSQGVAAIDQTYDGVTLQADDTMVVAETNSDVTLVFGD